MVSIDQVERGVAAYLDKELMPILPETGFQKILIGTGISLIIRKCKNQVVSLQDNEIVKMMGIFDENGDVDVDALKEELTKQISDKGFKVEVPIIGVLTFKKDDVAKLYDYIVGGK